MDCYARNGAGRAIRHWTVMNRLGGRASSSSEFRTSFFLRWFLFAFYVHLNMAGCVSCEINHDDEYTLAYINITYVDPLTKKFHTVNEEIGKFGDSLVDKVSGVVVHVSTRNGTSNSGCELPYDHKVPRREPWIALVRRGECTYAQKIMNAVKQNASAIVVYDDQSGATQKISFRERKIVSVFIPRDRGERIAELVDNGTVVRMYISLGSRQSVHYTNINRTSVLFVSISFIVLMIISLAWLIFYYVQRFRYINAKDQLARQLCSAAKKALAKIPLRTIKDADAELECCAVCIEPYKVSDIVRILPCKHQFHRSCIDPWLLDQRTCPMCKMDILKFYGLVYTGSQESVVQLDVEEVAGSGNGEPQLVVALPPEVPRQASQEACGPPAFGSGTNPRSQSNQEEPKQASVLPQRGQDSGTNDSQTPKTHIDCIKITMLENSPMALRQSHNRPAKTETNSMSSELPSTNTASALEQSVMIQNSCDAKVESIEETDVNRDNSPKETKDSLEESVQNSDVHVDCMKTLDTHSQEST